MELNWLKLIGLLIWLLASARLADTQGTTAATVPPGCQSIKQLSSAQTDPSGSSCNVSDSVLRVQCETGYCQFYTWSLSACNQSCQNGGTGPSNSSMYICPSNCQTVSSPSSCTTPPNLSSYACGTTTTSTTTSTLSTTTTTTMPTTTVTTTTIPTTTASTTTTSTSTVPTTTVPTTTTATTTTTVPTTTTPTTTTTTSTTTTSPTTTTTSSTTTTSPTTTSTSSTTSPTTPTTTVPTTTVSTTTLPSSITTPTTTSSTTSTTTVPSTTTQTSTTPTTSLPTSTTSSTSTTASPTTTISTSTTAPSSTTTKTTTTVGIMTSPTTNAKTTIATPALTTARTSSTTRIITTPPTTVFTTTSATSTTSTTKFTGPTSSPPTGLTSSTTMPTTKFSTVTTSATTIVSPTTVTTKPTTKITNPSSTVPVTTSSTSIPTTGPVTTPRTSILTGSVITTKPVTGKTSSVVSTTTTTLKPSTSASSVRTTGTTTTPPTTRSMTSPTGTVRTSVVTGTTSIRPLSTITTGSTLTTRTTVGTSPSMTSTTRPPTSSNRMTSTTRNTSPSISAVGPSSTGPVTSRSTVRPSSASLSTLSTVRSTPPTTRVPSTGSTVKASSASTRVSSTARTSPAVSSFKPTTGSTIILVTSPTSRPTSPGTTKAVSPTTRPISPTVGSTLPTTRPASSTTRLASSTRLASFTTRPTSLTTGPTSPTTRPTSPSLSSKPTLSTSSARTALPPSTTVTPRSMSTGTTKTILSSKSGPTTVLTSPSNVVTSRVSGSSTMNHVSTSRLTGTTLNTMPTTRRVIMTTSSEATTRGPVSTVVTKATSPAMGTSRMGTSTSIKTPPPPSSSSPSIHPPVSTVNGAAGTTISSRYSTSSSVPPSGMTTGTSPRSGPPNTGPTPPPPKSGCSEECPEVKCSSGQVKCKTANAACACVNTADISKCVNMLSVTITPNCTTSASVTMSTAKTSGSTSSPNSMPSPPPPQPPNTGGTSPGSSISTAATGKPPPPPSGGTTPPIKVPPPPSDKPGTESGANFINTSTVPSPKMASSTRISSDPLITVPTANPSTSTVAGASSLTVPHNSTAETIPTATVNLNNPSTTATVNLNNPSTSTTLGGSDGAASISSTVLQGVNGATASTSSISGGQNGGTTGTSTTAREGADATASTLAKGGTNASSTGTATVFEAEEPTATGRPMSTIMPTIQPAKNCTVCKGKPECVCPEGQIGDGLDCAVDQCATKLCAWNEVCQGSWSKSNCQFRTSFICACDPEIGCNTGSTPKPPDEASASGNVSKKPTGTSPSRPSTANAPADASTPKPPDEASASGNVSKKPTGTSPSSPTKANAPVEGATTPPPATVMPAKNCTVCKGSDCICPTGQIGDGLDCVPDQCATKKCAWNEYCQGYWSKTKCQFTVSFVCLCDPDIGCTTGTTPPEGTISGHVSHKGSPSTAKPPSPPAPSNPSVEPPDEEDEIAASGYVSKRQSVTTSTSTSTTTTPTSTSTTTTTSTPTSTSTSTSTTTSTTSPTPTATSSTTTTSTTSGTPTGKPSTPNQCINRTILDAVVTGGCGYKDNVTRIVCGDGKCVPFDTAYMDCKKDCSDGIDEQCMPGFYSCDGCTCVAPEDVKSACSDMSSVSTITPCSPFTIPPQLAASGYVSKRPSVTTPGPSTITTSTVTAGGTVIRTFTPKEKNNCTVCHTCKCPEGLVGDGITCVPDQCLNMTCAWNEYCEGTWSKSETCQFTSKFQCLCDPAIGCNQEASGVVTLRASPTPSTSTTSRPTLPPKDNCTVCRGNNCSCPTGYIGDGIDCVPDQCATLKCAWNEMCEGFWYKSEKCNFTSTFRCVCDPQIGCGTASTPPQPVVCGNNEFLCRTGHRKCIPCAWVEDKLKDCDNGEDEESGAAFESKCITSTIPPNTQYPASGVVTHKPVKTEPPKQAAVTSSTTARAACGSNFFTCSNAECVPCAWVNDTVKDCKSGEDETPAAVAACAGATKAATSSGGGGTAAPAAVARPAGATVPPTCGPSSFTCPSNGQCVPCAWVNDHVNDCPNGEDESASAAKSCPGAAAATASSLGTARPSDTCHDGKTTCQANSQCVNKVDGTFQCVCNENYYDSNGKCILHPCFDPNVTPCDSHAWCDTGNSTTLTASYTCHCILPYTGDGKTCPNQAKNVPAPCTTNQFKCPSDGTCIPMAWVLDHVRDCPNGDDEQAGLIDECEVGKATCDSHAKCINIPKGGYNCTCQLPYYGNGFSCWQPSPEGNIIPRIRRDASIVYRGRD